MKTQDTEAEVEKEELKDKQNERFSFYCVLPTSVMFL